MFQRLLRAPPSKSFFLFGARGTGKSTYVKKQWGQNHFYVNLLLDRWERRYQGNPDLLIADIDALEKRPEWVVIDEVQKVPKLLDAVHELIETSGIKFVLTGSSARKLKKASANLLAGRAFHHTMYPLTHRELGSQFDLDTALSWGTMPSIYSHESGRAEYLRSYAQTYLREEILQEQLVRNGVAFRNFLEITAQENGKTINFSKIARDTHVDTKTIQTYFQILEDTLIGYLIPAYTRSARKSVKLQPKFYLFDSGVKRALEQSLRLELRPGTSAYGAAFEHFIVLECIRLNSYLKADFKISHYQTTAGGEIDLILSRAKEVIAVEIKSRDLLDEVEVRKLSRTAEPLSPGKIYYVSNDPTRSKIDGVLCLHWKDFFEQVFEL
ncbi:MAG: ATP-binding protein [Deltaproteobacteria bacterium]|nr:ATP-binding protein [Deltaproteobacteria bacterium]